MVKSYNVLFVDRKARDLTGEFKFIVNTEEYVQALEVEECIGSKSFLCKVSVIYKRYLLPIEFKGYFKEKTSTYKIEMYDT